MKEKKIIVIIIGMVIVATTVGVVYFYNQPKPSVSQPFETQWISSGPFAISQLKYRIGENIFLSIHGLKPNESGNILIIQPDGRTWTTIPFNGTLKSDFNYYNKPVTNVAKKIFNPEELVGTWKVIFQGVTYDPLSFEIVNEWMPGAEAEIKRLNPNSTQIVGPPTQ